MNMLEKVSKASGVHSDNPSTLHRMLLLVGTVSIALIVTLSAWGFYKVFNGFVVDSAEGHAIGLSGLMLELVSKDIIVVQEGQQKISVTTESIGRLNQNLQSFLRHFDVTKVKLFDASRRIVYSTDSKIIGKQDTRNERLELALQGKVTSVLTVKSAVRDLAEEQHFNADVVETYVPIFDSSRRPIGSFEIYIHVSKYRDSVVTGVVWSTAILAIVLLSVFAISLTADFTVSTDVTLPCKASSSRSYRASGA